MKCPCHSGKEYTACCAPYHLGKAPPNPTDLMRSRYSAYALDNVDYIVETTHTQHPDHKRPRDQWKAEIHAFSEGNQFTDLEILEAKGNTVTFRAHLGKGSFTEKSAFEKEGGRWRYKSALSIS